MLIVGEMKLSDIIHHDYTLVPVINRFDIQLGFGDSSIEDICKEKNINLEFFLTILNTFHDPQYFQADYLKSISAEVLIKYLRKAHRFYLDIKIPEIQKMIADLIDLGPINQKTIILIQKFFNDYIREFASHVDREEEVVYPYVIRLERCLLTNIDDEWLNKEVKEYSISNYEEDHEDVEEKLFDLKNLLIKYLQIDSSKEEQYVEISYNLLRELFVLEKELNEHSRIEDLILVPKVEEMEDKYRSNH